MVNDGSTDQTWDQISKLQSEFPDNCIGLNLYRNVGKAAAVRAGALKALEKETHYLAYWDADLSTPLEEIHSFLNFAEKKPEAVMIMGSRIKLHGSTVVVRNEFRHYSGRIIATLISNLLGLAVYDTQCGAKLIKANEAKAVFKDAFISKWLFDVEIIFRILEKHGYQHISNRLFEIPISKWVDKGASKVSWTYLFKLPFDLLKLQYKYRAIRQTR